MTRSSSLVAPTTASAERVNPVYETYSVGDHIDEVKEAIDLGCESCAGRSIDATRLQHAEKFVRDQLEWLHEEGAIFDGANVDGASFDEKSRPKL